MIKTAEEIRKITKITPSAKATKILKKIESEIVKCAKKGERKAIYRFRASENDVNAVSNELHKAGYEVTIFDMSDPREGDGYYIQFTVKW